MPALAKKQLETICVYALNQVGRLRRVDSVHIGEAFHGPLNWTLCKVEPRLALADVRKSCEIIRALQREYRLGT